MKTLTLEAPAKINLTLDILGRRTDGYHDMRMVMQAVSLGDTVTVAEAAGGFSLLTEGISLPAGKVHFGAAAADAFFHRLGRRCRGWRYALPSGSRLMRGLGAAVRMWRRCCGACGPCTPRICRGRRWRRSGWQWAAMCPSASGAAHVLQRDGVRS